MPIDYCKVTEEGHRCRTSAWPQCGHEAKNRWSSALWVILAVAALLPNAACTTQASTATALNQQDPHQSFGGDWAYTRKCDSGHYFSLTLNEVGEAVSGAWSEGTNIRGSDGLLTGTRRDERLFVQYCSQDGEKGFKACPEYGEYQDYFIREGDSLVRHQKFGDAYKRGIALHRHVAGAELPIDSEGCTDGTDEEREP